MAKITKFYKEVCRTDFKTVQRIVDNSQIITEDDNVILKSGNQILCWTKMTDEELEFINNSRISLGLSPYVRK